jgi:hypothetical protein
MKMRTPIVAMLWENWRVTRVEAVQRLALGLVAGSGAMLVDDGAIIAFWILIVLHGMCVWFSTLKLNGGRFMDGYKPGFPFYLLYTRPVPTVVLVGVAMVYDAISCAALYVMSAAALGLVFGHQLPLFSVVAWILVSHFCYLCVQWSSPSRVVQWVGSIAFSLPMFFLLRSRVESPLRVEFSLVENAVMILAAVVLFGITVAGVTRQRRGAAIANAPRAAASGGYPEWLVSFFRFQCPTSSATRAQVWFELKSSGLPVVAIGLAVAIVIFFLFAIGVPIEPVRYAAAPIAIFAIPIVLFHLGGNAFGIRRKQGRAYASAFESTQPYGIARQAGVKVVVRTACVLVALIAIGSSVWASGSFLGEWVQWPADGKNAVPKLLELRSKVEAAFAGLTGYAYAALAFVVAIGVASTVAWQAAREALRARYPRRMLVVNWLPVVWGVAIMLAALAGRSGIASMSQVTSIVLGLMWLAIAAIALSTIYLLWNGLVRRTLPIRYACGAFVISAVFAAAWLTMLQTAGVQPAQMPVSKAVSVMWPVLLPLMTSFLAPWALGRIRHT